MGRILNSRMIHLVGLFCFAAHLGLIVHHTYFTASKRNTVEFPRPEGLAPALTEGWHNYLDLNRWDAVQYQTAVVIGYRNPADPSRPLDAVQWWPGWVLLVKPVYALTGWPAAAAQSALSALFTLGFWVLLWSPRMRDELGVKALAVVSALWICWPGAMFWFAGMTEALLGFLLLAMLHCWFARREWGIAALMAFATCVKQVFLPLLLAFGVLWWVRRRPRAGAVAGWTALGLAGFLGWGFYCWWAFGDFFASTTMMIEKFEKDIKPWSLIDLNMYAKHLMMAGGLTAFASMFFLLWALTRMWGGELSVEKLKGWRAAAEPVPTQVALWWLALAYTAFIILGDTYTEHPYDSIMRYQTVNVPLALLWAWQLREAAWARIVALMTPLCWVFVYWQVTSTVQYWHWNWVS